MTYLTQVGSKAGPNVESLAEAEDMGLEVVGKREDCFYMTGIISLEADLICHELNLKGIQNE